MRNAYWLLPILLSGCAPVHLPEPSDATLAIAQQKMPDASLTTLAAGRDLVLEKCANCHRPPRPSETQTKRWAKVFPKMVVKAKLTPDARALVETYLVASSGVAEER